MAPSTVALATRGHAVPSYRPRAIACADSKSYRKKESTMIEKKASVHWDGAGKTGKGKISTETGALQGYPYGAASRFEDDRKGTNPEEIVGAAHAACFTMAFAFACEKAGVATTSID